MHTGAARTLLGTPMDETGRPAIIISCPRTLALAMQQIFLAGFEETDEPAASDDPHGIRDELYENGEDHFHRDAMMRICATDEINCSRAADGLPPLGDDS